MTVGGAEWFGRFMERTELELSLERCCKTCGHYQDESSYEDPYGAVYCLECPNVEYFKNWPFKNGCKRYEADIWLITTDDEYEEMTNS